MAKRVKKAAKVEPTGKPEAAAIPETASASVTATVGDVAIPKIATSKSAKAGSGFVVKHGQIMVGIGEVRAAGEVIRAEELTPEEAEKFLARGAIEQA